MNVVVRRFDRIAAVEELDSPQRFAELAPNLLRPRDSLAILVMITSTSLLLGMNTP